jgi:ADP-heptose:LPS heptosyltransferase
VTINAQGRSRAHQPGLKPAEYVELARGLAKATGAVVLIGDLAYRRLGRQVQIASVSLPVWAALIERSAMWLGECTGPYHLAAALETPTVLFTAAGVDSRPWLASNYNRVSNRVFKDVSGKQARLTEVRKVLCSTLEATDKEDRQ